MLRCRNCNPNRNPHSEFTEEYYDHMYVDSEYVHNQECSCDYDDEDRAESYAKELAEVIAGLHDISDIIEALREMDPDNEKDVNNLIEGIAFYDTSVTDQYGDVLMEGEVPSDLRVLKISSQVDYVSDLEDYCRLLRGEFDNLVYCERREKRVYSPLRIIDMMQELTKNDPESLVLDN